MSDRTPVAATVVVCTRERPRLAADAIASVLADDPPPAEVVVVDQSDRPDPHVADLHAGSSVVRYVWTGTPGLCAARNLGSDEARNETIVYCDDDVLVRPGWLSALVAGLGGNGEPTVATGRVLAGTPEVPRAFVPATVLGEERAVYEGRLDRDVLAGGSMAIRRQALRAVGGWDTRLGPGTSFPAAEDNDLGFRLLEAGYRVVYVPEAVVSHRAWRPPTSYPGVRWRYGLGKGGFYAKHASLRDRHVLRRGIRDVGRRFARLPRVVWRRPVYALGELAYAAGVLYGFGRWQLTAGRAG